jgi:hypothetical protein
MTIHHSIILLYLTFSQAIRGAGASFGIVTEFVLETHPEPGPTVQYSYTFECVVSIFALESAFKSDLLFVDLGTLETWLRPLLNGSL